MRTLAGLLSLIGMLSCAEPSDDRTQEMRDDPPPSHLEYLKLPEGNLNVVVIDENLASFVDISQTQEKSSGIRTGVFYGIYREPVDVGDHSVTQIVRGISFNCQANQYSEVGVLSYDEAGVLIMWSPAGQTIPVNPKSPMGGAESIICRDVRTQSFRGHAEAHGFAFDTWRKAGLDLPRQ